VEACAGDQAPRQRKRLYLIDGDFDALQGIAPPPLQHLYRLDVYCSENLLLSELAAIEIARECDTNATWHDLAHRLSLKSLFDRVNALLVPLFIVYAVAELLDAGVTTSGYHVRRLCQIQHDPKTLSAYVIRKRIANVRSAILAKASIAHYRVLRKEVTNRVGTDRQQFGRFISGKTYLLPILHAVLLSEVNFPGSIETLKVRLAANCELDIDSGLAAAVLAAVR
jgi:hypothetical protein